MQSLSRTLFAFIVILGVSCSSDDTGPIDMGEDAPADVANSDDVAQEADVSAGADASNDMSAEDMSVTDMTVSDDMSADMSADMSVDMAVGEGCAPGTTTHPGVDGVIVACQTVADTVNQCDAGALCGTGWHMCTSSEYRAHYEAMENTAAADATYWVGGCIRAGADPTDPVDGACADCTGTQTGGDADVAFSCVNNIRVSSDQLYVGIRAGTACSFVGTTNAGNDAFWSALPSYYAEDGAFCCAD